MLRSKFVKCLMSILNWQVNSCSNLVSFFIVMTKNFPVNFKLTQFLLWIKGSHQTPNFRLSKVLWWKFAIIPHIIFESTSQFSFKCCISIQCHKTKLLYTFFRSNIIYFGQKQPVKVHIFEIFECSGQNLSNASCQLWTDKSIPLQIWNHSSLPWYKTPL